MHKKLVVYLEDVPVNEKLGGSGLSKAALPILKSIDFKVDSYIINCLSNRLKEEDIEPFVRKKVLLINRIGFFERKLWRVGKYIGLEFCIFIQDFVNKIFRNISEVNSNLIVLAVVGVDPGAIFRAYSMAKTMRAQIWFYLVDDVESHPMNIKNNYVPHMVDRILKVSHGVFAVTRKLGLLLAKRHFIPWTYLPLIPPNIQSVSRHTWKSYDCMPEYFGIYLGSINHLYENELIDLFKVLKNFRKKYPDAKFCFASSVESVKRLFRGNVPDFVDVRQNLSDLDLAKLLSRSLFAFLPYSFAENDRNMVSTSFPSKSLTYLSYSNNIIYYGPTYSSAFEIFSRYPIIYFAHSLPELECCIKLLMEKKGSQSEFFRKIIDVEFSEKIVVNAIIRGLDIDG